MTPESVGMELGVHDLDRQAQALEDQGQLRGGVAAAGVAER
jgi:hypothetical protein